MDTHGVEGCVFVEVVRLLVVLVGTVAGHSLGELHAESSVVGPVIGAAVGYGASWLAVVLGSRVAARGERRTRFMTGPELLTAVVVGAPAAALGLICAAVLLVLVPTSWMIPIAALVVWGSGALGMAVGRRRSAELLAVLGLPTWDVGGGPSPNAGLRDASMLVDATALLDGRLLSIARSGFVVGDLLVPRFVLDDVERCAREDEPASRRRARGALDLLTILESETPVSVRIIADRVPEASAPVAKILVSCRILGVGLITADPRMARLAETQGVQCLNLTRLAEVLNLPKAEEGRATVDLVRKGTEIGQAVGYLDDGTMVVVNQAGDRIGERVLVRLGTQVPTSRGRLVFGELDEAMWPGDVDDEALRF